MGDCMKIGQARTDLAAIVAAIFPPEWGVIDHLPDAVYPPCALIGWADPWMRPSTHCVWQGAMEIMCVAQRLEPGGKLETLEEMVGLIIPALKRTDYTVVDTTSPYPMQIGGVDYLAASINITYELE
jgi:hypothetical protein